MPILVAPFHQTSSSTSSTGYHPDRKNDPRSQDHHLTAAAIPPTSTIRRRSAIDPLTRRRTRHQPAQKVIRRHTHRRPRQTLLPLKTRLGRLDKLLRIKIPTRPNRRLVETIRKTRTPRTNRINAVIDQSVRPRKRSVLAGLARERGDDDGGRAFAPPLRYVGGPPLRAAGVVEGGGGEAARVVEEAEFASAIGR